MKFVMVSMLILVCVAICRCESGMSIINAALVEDIVDECPSEVNEILETDAEYQVTVTLDRPCVDEKIDNANRTREEETE